MTGLRPLLICFFALINTVFWAGLLHVLGLLDLMPHSMRIVVMSCIFVLSLIILLSFGAGESDGDSSGSGGESGPSAAE
jgi:hypothetical protein